MSDNLLVNSIYSLSYFSLPGVDQIQYPDTFWWSSKPRFAAEGTAGTYRAVGEGGVSTSEILEIDLGRIREINFLNFDIIRAPVDIRVEYDAISTPDREAVWLPVSGIEGLSFDNSVSFDTNNRTAWLNAEFNFTDSKGNMVHTRYLRIVFTRRDEPWPTTASAPFVWPIFAKHLRLGRYISQLRDTIGPLLTQDTPLDPTEVALTTLDGITTHEVRQQFVYPASAVRADTTPSMLGFGVLIQITEEGDEDEGLLGAEGVEFGWSLWDVTAESAPIQLRSGSESVAVSSGLSWFDFYLDDAHVIEGDLTKTYELRFFSLNASSARVVFTSAPNSLSNRAIPGTLGFTNGSTSVSTSVDTRNVLKVGDYIVRPDAPEQVYLVNAITATTITLNVPYSGVTNPTATGVILYPYSSYDEGLDSYIEDATKNLVMRVWADVGDEGRDVLGNPYRYVTRKERARYVRDNTRAGWMSEPVPTPDAVEALYFDVRGTNDEGNRILTLIEAIRISPRTPGVRMNVYYSQQNLGGERPTTTNDWDYLLWTPIQETYTLRRDEVIEFPQAIKTAFVKLEFTALNPLPFRVPTYPALPPKRYRRYPTWVEDQFNNSTIRATVEDWFLRNSTPVQIKVLQTLANPVHEFEYKQREFLAALSLGKVKDSQLISAGIVDVKEKALIDPVTAGKVYIQGLDRYQSSLLIGVEQDSLLGRMVTERFDPNILTDPVELPASANFSDDVATVSTTNDRITESYQNLAQVPMRFNRTARHAYQIEEAEFNKKAYFVGIDEVRFLRNDYTVVRDDALITDILYDDEMLDENTWDRLSSSSIPDNSILYVSYSVNPSVVDEQIFLSGFEPIALTVKGAPARNLKVFTAPNEQGIQFFQNDDYNLTYGTDENGQRVTYIARSEQVERMGVALQDIAYLDVATVIGHAFIPSPPIYDEGIVTGIAAITGDDSPFIPGFGAGTFGGGNYGNLTSIYLDAETSVGGGVTSGVDVRIMNDEQTATGDAVITAVESYN